MQIRKTLFLLLILCYSCKADNNIPNLEQNKLNDTNEINEPNHSKNWSLNLVAVGDIMLGSGYPNENEVPQDCGESLIFEAIDDLQSADITFGNLEGAVINSGKPAKNCQKSNNCYAFRMKECAVSVLKNAGFDILNIANNHLFDFGNSGQINTIKVLDKENIKYCGIESHPYSIIEFNGKTIAFIGFANSPQTLRMTNLQNAVKYVKELKAEYNIVVVSFHGGAEGQNINTLPNKLNISWEKTEETHFYFHIHS